MKTGRKLTVLVLAALMLVTVLAAGPWTLNASASETETISLEATYVNPLYAHLITEDDLVQPSRPVLYADDQESEDAEDTEVKYATTVEEAGKVLREGMKNRAETVVVYYHMKNYSNEAAEELMYQLDQEAIEHTGVPTEGDYLAWQYGGWQAKTGGSLSGSDADLTITYTLTYYTTAEQEAKVDAKVKDILSKLNVSDDTDYYKIKAVYDYVCANVVYDKAHVNNTSYKTQYTAYGALIDGTSVCQGYALAVYRLALELDVDCRLIAGTGQGEAHGWNIVELDDKYYNLDATWDAGTKEYKYFLVCDANFTDHVRGSTEDELPYDYDSEEFHKAHPTAESDYVPCSHSYGEDYVITAAACEKEGVGGRKCKTCGHVDTFSIKATGHQKFTTQVVAPSCTAEGYDEHTCTACGYRYADNFTDIVPHTYVETVVKPTCTEKGYTLYACSVCRDEYTDNVTDIVPHTYTATVIEPTCTEKGYTLHVCDVCGDEYTDEPVEKLPHKYGTLTVDPTCTSRGYDQHICSECSYKYSDNYVAPLDHVFADDICTECGARAVYRVYGKTRYETSFTIADTLKSELCINQFDTIIVANGEAFADALSGSYLAAQKSAPILLANGRNNDDVKEYIKANLASGGTVYLLGGTNALPATLETGLESFKVVRLAGATRYDTNLAILTEAGVKDQEILICTGTDFADSLSASATGLPILLVNSTKGELTEEQTKFLKSTSGKFTIIGGDKAVGSEIETALKKIGTVNRLSGDNRFETCVLVAEHFFSAPNAAVVAYGYNFPDGLCGGPLAYAAGAPMILTSAGYEATAVEYTTEHKITQGYVLGGTGLVSDDIARATFGMDEEARVTVW